MKTNSKSNTKNNAKNNVKSNNKNIPLKNILQNSMNYLPKLEIIIIKKISQNLLVKLKKLEKALS